jgi:hypothetical protein
MKSTASLYEQTNPTELLIFVNDGWGLSLSSTALVERKQELLGNRCLWRAPTASGQAQTHRTHRHLPACPPSQTLPNHEQGKQSRHIIIIIPSVLMHD